ncbi:MarR family winged helix-turn-helix transcriptional regulator [Nocardia ignorata]|uniref:DNA-binding MarR family transcriptional regulator n=1 Tax=Nocardia ignorata TaxID=145285 RepID=A0A4R6PK24_NOCIG|nr:hypothetical protein [Nocardia ignorata]TDP38441.1 hypothetical protein DFR75_10396 [Nocardia ignorata]
MAERRLIGYQVKRLDQLIEAAFDRAVEAVGMTRREWQTLSTIERDHPDRAELVRALRPFWELNGESVDAVIQGLTERGWITGASTGRRELTSAGRRAYESATDSVGTIRRRMADGIDADEFTACTRTLERMIANLESAT